MPGFIVTGPETMSFGTAGRARLALPQVTLCAASSVNLPATVAALRACLDQVAFASCKLLTDRPIAVDHCEIEVVHIPQMHSAHEYSDFVLRSLVDHIDTSHCLIVQWDGHILNANAWQPRFLDYDYIGASWPQFDDGHDVGNGGFSLRSRRLMKACGDATFVHGGAEDTAIARNNRPWLESLGMRFAPAHIADAFATERAGDLSTSFGYHGVFNMPRAIGLEQFWNLYVDLDDRGTVATDLFSILRDLGAGPRRFARRWRLIADRWRDRVRRRRTLG